MSIDLLGLDGDDRPRQPQSEVEPNISGQDPRASIDALPDAELQRAVLELEDWAIRRMLLTEPETLRISFGGGQQPGPLVGDPHDPFNGVAILNTSPVALSVGFASGGAQGAPIVCPASTMLVLPVRYSNLAFAISAADAAGPAYSIAIQRLRFPQGPFAAPLSATGITSVAPQGASTATNAAASVGVASAQVLAANPARKGLQLVNDSANKIYLGLGAAAVIGSGIPLFANGGAWDGRLADTLWQGSVAAIATAAASNLAVVEV